jgi:hypothetical protein
MRVFYIKFLQVLIRLFIVIAYPILVLSCIFLIPLFFVAIAIMLIAFILTGNWYINVTKMCYFPILIILKIDDWKLDVMFDLNKQIENCKKS